MWQLKYTRPSAEEASKLALLTLVAPELLKALEAMISAFEANIPRHCNADEYGEYNYAVDVVKKAKGELK